MLLFPHEKWNWSISENADAVFCSFWEYSYLVRRRWRRYGSTSRPTICRIRPTSARFAATTRCVPSSSRTGCTCLPWTRYSTRISIPEMRNDDTFFSLILCLSHYYRFFFLKFLFYFIFFWGLPACSILISHAQKVFEASSILQTIFIFLSWISSSFLEKGGAPKKGEPLILLGFWYQSYLGLYRCISVMFRFISFCYSYLFSFSFTSIPRIRSKRAFFIFIFIFIFLYSYVVRDELTSSLPSTPLSSPNLPMRPISIPSIFLLTFWGPQSEFYVYTSIHPIVVYTLAVNLV